MSITDRLGRELKDIRISVTDRCNFRCFFCMPADKEINFLNREELLSYEEIAFLVKSLSDIGIRKVRITGGEPLLRASIENLIELISNIPEIKDIALTTNGFRLGEMAPKLKSAGLKRITVSLLSLEEDRYRAMVGKDIDLKKIIESIDRALDVGLSPLKVNMVVVRGVNDDEVLSMAEFCRDRGIILRFIEFMDVGTMNHWSLDRVVTASEILSTMSKKYSFEPVDGGINETALRYRYSDTPLEFGIIASVSKPFCKGCTRLRLSADGKLFTCLFSSEGYDIKSLIRSGAGSEDIVRTVINLWNIREDRYSEERFLRAKESERDRVEMFRVGG